MENPFFTIGHSKRPLSEFVGLLKESKIQLVGDVRTVPRSRANPQYDRNALPKALKEFQIEYEASTRTRRLTRQERGRGHIR